MGRGVPSPLPFPIADFWRFSDSWRIFLSILCNFVSLLGVAEIVRRLEVVPVFRRRAGRWIAELFPAGNGLDLIHYKRKRMRCIRRFVIVDWSKPTVTDAAFAAHCLQPRPILSAQRTVCASGVRHAVRSPPIVPFCFCAFPSVWKAPPGVSQGRPIQERGRGIKQPGGHKSTPGVCKKKKCPQWTLLQIRSCAAGVWSGRRRMFPH